MKTHAQKPTQSPHPTAPHLAGKRPNPQTAGRVVHSITPLQRAIGNHESERSLPGNAEAVAIGSDPSEAASFAHDFSQVPVFSKMRIRIQTKLTVNAPGDIYEQEADRVAEQVTRMPESRGRDSVSQPIQTKTLPTTNSGKIEAPPIVDEVLRSPGQQLDSPTRSFMEQRFGYDFSDVRVQSDSRSEESARAVNALAYTVGHRMIFQAGAYQPHTHEGRRLLAHELTHVLHQRGTNGSSGGNSGTTVDSSAPAGLYRQIAESDPDWLKKLLSGKAKVEQPIEPISIMSAIRHQQARANLFPFGSTLGNTFHKQAGYNSLPLDFDMRKTGGYGPALHYKYGAYEREHDSEGKAQESRKTEDEMQTKYVDKANFYNITKTNPSAAKDFLKARMEDRIEEEAKKKFLEECPSLKHPLKSFKLWLAKWFPSLIRGPSSAAITD